MKINLPTENESNQGFVVASVSEAGFVGVEVGHDQIDQLFDQIHRAYHPHSELAVAVSHMMDKAPQYPMLGGFAHRIYYGHSLSSIKDVYDQYGWEGFMEWSKHIGADFCSPDGLPLPFALELKSLLSLNAHEAVQALCVNATDLLACSLGISAMTAIPEPTIKVSLAAYKLWAGIAHSDPSLIITAGAGLIIGAGVLLQKWSEGDYVKLSMEDFKGGPAEGPNVTALFPGSVSNPDAIDLGWKG